MLQKKRQLEDTNKVVRNRKQKKYRQHNGQKKEGHTQKNNDLQNTTWKYRQHNGQKNKRKTDKQSSTKHYMENYISSKMSPTNKPEAMLFAPEV